MQLTRGQCIERLQQEGSAASSDFSNDLYCQSETSHGWSLRYIEGTLARQVEDAMWLHLVPGKPRSGKPG
jgi:hypothetical protein